MSWVLLRMSAIGIDFVAGVVKVILVMILAGGVWGVMAAALVWALLSV